MTKDKNVSEKELEALVRSLAEAWGLTPSQRDIESGRDIRTFRSSFNCRSQRTSSDQEKVARSRHARPRRAKISSYRVYGSRSVRAIDYFPFDPSYLFCGVGSVPNYKKKRFARLRNRVSLVG